MDKLVAKFFNYSCKGLNLANLYPLPIPVVVILIRIRKFVHRCTQDHNYSRNKVSKKTVIVPHFFVCLFLVLDAGENF